MKNIETIKPVHTCLACGADALKPLMLLENEIASAQNIPAQNEVASEHAIDLLLCQCMSCGLVQLDVDPVDYYKDVIRAGGGTRTMTQLRHEEYDRLLAAMREHNIPGRNIIEIGCGQGEFLKMWDGVTEPADPLTGQRPRSLCLSGIEHKQDLVEKAQAAGLSVTRDFAEQGHRFPGAPFDAFVQFNFLEHQPDPRDMLRTIHQNLRPGALGLLTVPSFEYILQYAGYYEIMRDHIANYTEFTLTKLLSDCGFRVLETRLVNRDTIEAIVECCNPEELTSFQFNGQPIDVSGLKKNYEKLASDIQEHCRRLAEEKKSIAVWGASHQGFALLATSQLGGQIRYIIDSADFKQGRFAPASHIPIVAPAYFHEDPVDEILIVAPGYTDEIASIIREKLSEKVKIRVLKTEKIEEYEPGI